MAIFNDDPGGTMKPTTGGYEWTPTGEPSEVYRLHREVVRLTGELKQLHYIVFMLLVAMFAIIAATI